jgi:cytosine permease
VAMITWAISTAVGEVALQYNFLVPAIVSMVVSFILYALLSKALDGTLNKNV